MSAAKTPAAPSSKLSKKMPQPPLSLTKAAKAVEVSTSTLRRAIEDGKLKAVKSEEGHWRIKIDELMQYKSNELDTPAAGLSASPVTEGVAQSVAPPATEPVDRRAGTVSRDMHDTVVSMYEARLRDKEKELERLENTADNYRSDFKDMQQKYDNNQLLLTDQREEAEKLKARLEVVEIEKEAGEEGGHFWRNAIAASALLGLVCAAFYFRTDLAEQWVNVTAKDADSAAAIESEVPQG